MKILGRLTFFLHFGLLCACASQPTDPENSPFYNINSVLPKTCDDIPWEKTKERPGTKAELWTRGENKEQLLQIGPIKEGMSLFDYADTYARPVYSGNLLPIEWPELLESSFFHLTKGNHVFIQKNIEQTTSGAYQNVNVQYLTLTQDGKYSKAYATLSVRQKKLYVLIYFASTPFKINDCKPRLSKIMPTQTNPYQKSKMDNFTPEPVSMY